MQHFKFNNCFSIALGSKDTIGEFFKPGLSCSDILNKLEDSKDGFYWISLKRSKPIKVKVFTFFLFCPFISRYCKVRSVDLFCSSNIPMNWDNTLDF